MERNAERDALMRDMQQAYRDGLDAVALLGVGKSFIGAFGAADDAGYKAEKDAQKVTRQSMLRSVFVGAFLQALPKTIRTDRFNVLVQFDNNA